MGDEVSAFRDGGLGFWVLVRELDAVLVIATRENLDLAYDIHTTDRFFRFFCWLAANIGLEFKAQFSAGNFMSNIVLFEEDDHLLEEVERVGRHEELRVVVHEAISIFVNLESGPGLLAVLLVHVVLRGHSASSVRLAFCFGLIALLTLLFTLVMCFLIDHTLTISKVSPDLLVAGAWAGHPWVCQHLFESGSVRGIESHHLLKQVLELGSVDVVARFGLSMCLPESCRLSCSDKSIVRVTGVSTGEGRPLSDDHEEDDCGGEEVNAGALIWPAQLDLGSHVGLRAELSLEHARRIAALNRCRKTEICDF